MAGGVVWGAVRLVTEPPASLSGGIIIGLVGLAGLAMGGSFMWHAVRPFRIVVDDLGWTIRTADLARHLRWDEIFAVVITDAPDPELRRKPRVTLPRLVIVPAAGVEMKTPTTVDGRPAVKLFELNEVVYDRGRLVPDLAALAGGRLVDRCAPPALLPGEINLSFFLDMPDLVRLRRWLARLRALLLATWYLLVLVPALVAVVLAAQVHEALGAVVLLAGLIAVPWAGVRLGANTAGCRDLIDRTTTLIGTRLFTHGGAGLDESSPCIGLHSGEVTVLPPGSRRGYGKAWLLGNPVPLLLLGDPRTGRLRGPAELRTLSAVLRESAMESDRVAGRQLDEPAVAAQAAGGQTSGALGRELVDAREIGKAAGLWLSLTALGRAIVWLGIVITIAFAGGWMLETTSFLGPALLYGAVALFSAWLLYALYRILGLLAATVRILFR